MEVVEKLKKEDYFYNSDMNCYYKLPVDNGVRKMAIKLYTDFIVRKDGEWINNKTGNKVIFV